MPAIWSFINFLYFVFRLSRDVGNWLLHEQSVHKGPWTCWGVCIRSGTLHFENLNQRTQIVCSVRENIWKAMWKELVLKQEASLRKSLSHFKSNPAPPINPFPFCLSILLALRSQGFCWKNTFSKERRFVRNFVDLQLRQSKPSTPDSWETVHRNWSYTQYHICLSTSELKSSLSVLLNLSLHVNIRLLHKRLSYRLKRGSESIHSPIFSCL